MKIRPSALAGAVTLLALAVPAQAATYYFTFSGDFDASFELDSNPSAALYGSDFTYSTSMYGYFRLRNFTVTSNGVTSTNGDILFYPASAAGGVRVALGSTLLFSLLAIDLFTGPTSNPTIKLGEFNFTTQKLPFSTKPQPTNTKLVISATRPVSAVPEPAGWAMLIAGFTLIGAAARGRRVRTAITYG